MRTFKYISNHNMVLSKKTTAGNYQKLQIQLQIAWRSYFTLVLECNKPTLHAATVNSKHYDLGKFCKFINKYVVAGSWFELNCETDEEPVRRYYLLGGDGVWIIDPIILWPTDPQQVMTWSDFRKEAEDLM